MNFTYKGINIPDSFLTGITTDISVVLDMFSIAIIEYKETNSYFN